MKKTVAIVGRPNVGKSALFNRLAGVNISIVHDQPGVTRDRISAECRRGAIPYQIIDTGGIGETTGDVLTEQVQTEADIALEIADLLLFVVDSVEGVTPIDAALARRLRRIKKPLILVCNKADSDMRSNASSEFSKLGFNKMIPVSAAHGKNIDELVDEIDLLLFTPEEIKEADESEEDKRAYPPLKIAIVGRPNAGKSSLINAILGDQRAMVSEVAGTTRDALDVDCQYNGKLYRFIDTAGIRRQSKIDNPVEIFSIQRSLLSIKRADVCLLVIDCADGAKMQDRKVAQTILEYNKPCILVMNKFDLFHPTAKKKDRLDMLKDIMEREFFFLKHAEIIATSAKNKEHIGKILQTVETMREQANNRIGTGILNRLLINAIENAPGPLGRSHHSFKLLYATQVNQQEDQLIPVPHFVLFANRASKLQESYLRYLETVIRSEWPAVGIPFKFSVRGKIAKSKL
jgi:GTP-binding protein